MRYYSGRWRQSNVSANSHSINPAAYTSIYSCLLLIAYKTNFDSSRQPLVFLHLNMSCNDWIPFCLRNLILRSVYRNDLKGSSFSTLFWQNTLFLFVGQSLYLYMLLFIWSTPSRSCVSATLKQYISITLNHYLRSCPFSLPRHLFSL